MSKSVSRRGRPRDEAARSAILGAAMALLRAQGYRAITIEAIAAKAGAGKQTIYRWWPSKAAVCLDALATHAEFAIGVPDTGKLAKDLDMFLEATFAALKRGSAPIVRSLMAEAQFDPRFAKDFRRRFIALRRRAGAAIIERAIERGELPRRADVEFLTDLVFGPMWYRLLNGHAPLDRRFKTQVVTAVVTSGAIGQLTRRGR